MSRPDKYKSGSFLDKIGLGGTGRVKKSSGLSRPQSESDFNELDEMQQKEVPLTDKEVEEHFRQMLDDMNLSEEKRKPLLDQTIEKKRQLLSMREKGYSTGPKSKLDTPADYINALHKSNLENLSGNKTSHLIESLRITLASNPVSWIKGFGHKGLDLVLNLLNECYSFNRGGLGEHRAKIQLECLRSLRAFMNNTEGLKQVFDQKEVSETLPAMVNIRNEELEDSWSFRPWTHYVDENGKMNKKAHSLMVFALVARSLDPQQQSVMQEAARLLGAVCLLSDQGGHERVLEAITISAENKGCDRFVPIVQGLNQQDNDSLRVCCMQLINAIVNIPEDFEYRIFLRNEFMRAGLHGLIEEIKKGASGDFATQIEIFLKHKEEDFEEFSEKFDCIHSEFDDPKECYELIQNLIADTPAEPLFLAILQHLLCIRDDNHIRSAYFKLIEECVAQIVLHRSGYDPDFRAKKFEIDVEALTGLVVEKLKHADEKRNDELNNKLEEALTQKQEADAQNEQLKKRNAELEEALKSGVFQKQSDFAMAQDNMAKNFVPPGPPRTGPPPPPPPPFPGMGAGPPPPPPPPMMGGMGPPPPPPPPGMGMPPPPPFGMPGFGPPAAPMPKPANIALPFGMKAKKKWNLDVPLKKANWKTIAPQKLSEKSFWVKVEEEKLVSDEILEGLMRFSTKAPPKSLKEENDKNNSIGGKKLKALRVLDSKAAQNLSILLGGSLKHMSFEAVKAAILRCDENVLSGNLLEQLINYLPPADQLKRLEDLQSQYEDLNDAEQFACTISTIKRLLPRLRSMKFKAQYVDTVQDIKPGIVAATAACEEIKSSKKLAKLLELVLLVGNVMNSGSRNGQAVGFEISYLPKLSNTKDVENRHTLLHYLVETVEGKFPEVLSFDEELIHLDKAARVSVETIQKSLRVMDSDLKNLETDLKNSKIPQGSEDKFFEIMSCFSKEARQQCDILQQMFSKIDSLYSDLAEYFSFDKNLYSVEEFFSDIKIFKDQFQQAYKDNVKLRETEEKIRRAKEAKAKAEQEKQERLARKKALVDINSNDDTGVMDNLLEALKTGQAFHRPDQKRKRAPRGGGVGDNKAQLHRSRSRSNIMVLSPSSRELITEISIDNGEPKSSRSHGRRSSRGEDQTEDLLRRLREL